MPSHFIVAKRFPINPKHPERNCWGCDKYCSATSLMCGNGSERTQHPAELFGEDWAEWDADSGPEPPDPSDTGEAALALSGATSGATPG